MRDRMENLINEMLDGRILLDEAVSEFQKLYIQKALERNADHISKTAVSLGIHRNTLSKRVNGHSKQAKLSKKMPARRSKSKRG
ncbi:MAG: helix-turn-helix domain-containing protein [Blastocatellia bacterium]